MVDSPSSIPDAEAGTQPSSEKSADATERSYTPAKQLLEQILEAHDTHETDEPLPKTIDGVVIARIMFVDENGGVRVAYPGTPSEGVLARAIARVSTHDIGREAALLFENGDRDKPLVMGLLVPGQTVDVTMARPDKQVRGDEQRVVLSAEKEIVLECGHASITLTRAGKILIKGTYVLTRSSGTNRIQGGSVQIN